MHCVGRSRPLAGRVINGRIGYLKGRRSRKIAVRGAPGRADEEPQIKPLLDAPDGDEDCNTVCSASDYSLSQSEDEAKLDLYKAGGLGALLAIITAALSDGWVASHEEVSLMIVFVVGYIGIIVEEQLACNKAGVALMMAVALWTIRSVAGDHVVVTEQLSHALGEVSEIIFFLLGAMTIVEVVDAHQGFKLITDVIKTRNKATLMWLVGLITFFMSSVLDNLTSTIVMVSLLRKLCPDPETRKLLGAVIVIAANAGGAWTPIGDVTTTMLWINGNITTVPTMRDLLIPSAISCVIPMALIAAFSDEVKGEFNQADMRQDSTPMAPRGSVVFGTGIAALLFVPVFKSVTGLPPCLGMLAGLGTLWLLTDAIHFGEDRETLQVPRALSRIDTEGIIFFLGILLSIACLDAAGVLKTLATFLDAHISSQATIATAIGLVSAVIDNVPLVAATMGMYDAASHPVDSQLWQMIAYCAGTGGSILIIGSAAGVAFMGMEKADFMWYLRKVSPWALVGYLAGVGAILALHGGEGVAVMAALP